MANAYPSPEEIESGIASMQIKDADYQAVSDQNGTSFGKLTTKDAAPTNETRTLTRLTGKERKRMLRRIKEAKMTETQDPRIRDIAPELQALVLQMFAREEAGEAFSVPLFHTDECISDPISSRNGRNAYLDLAGDVRQQLAETNKKIDKQL